MNNELQVESGKYTRICNKIIEDLCGANLSGTELAVCLLVLRKTYGWNKPTDEISISQFVLATNRTHQSIINSIKSLQLVNILILVNKGNSVTHSNEWKLNKYKDTWKLVKKGKLVKKTKKTSTLFDAQLVQKTVHTKDNTKDNTKDREVKKLFEYFCLQTKKNYLLTPARRRIIEKCLKDGYKPIDMLTAVDNFVKDDWGDRHKYMDLVYVWGTIRGINNLDKWIDAKPKIVEKLLK